MLVTSLLYMSCQAPIPSQPLVSKGSLSIQLGAQSARTLTPSIDMTVASYTILGTGPNGEAFQQSGITGNSCTQNLLSPGSWTITVHALNSSSTTIGSGQATVTVVAEQTASLTINVLPVSGTGTLSLGVSWNASWLSNPTIQASLTPTGGEAITLSFTVGSGNGTYSGQWATGYYRLSLQLLDGTTVAWSTIDTVRIVAGQTTSGSYTPSLSGTGVKFKVANSWGIGGWEHIPDGFFYITAAALKQAEVPAYFYTDKVSYNPTYVVVFSIDNPSRADVSVKIGLGTPQSPVATKVFDPSEFIDQGGNGFPSSNIVLDITEFANEINSNDLFLAVYDSSGNPATGSIESLSVERYTTYGTTPACTLQSYSSLPMQTTTGEWTYAYVHTAGAIGASRSIPSLAKKVQQLFTTRQLSDSEFSKLKQKLGVYHAGSRYNRIVDGHGTGLRPPTEKEWSSIRSAGFTIASIQAAATPKAAPSVDLSQDAAFPPIGNQGDLGSCTTFSTTYYIKTYEDAKENGWSISGSGWGGAFPGQPQANLDKIMSPKFVYNLTNWGVDNGSTFTGNLLILTDIGTASWKTMPYDGTDYTSWPSEAAWREAPKYRADMPDVQEWGTQYYFTVDSDAEVNILETLLQNNIPVSISVDANQFQYLDSQDVWGTTNYNPTNLNHETTVVGYAPYSQ